MRVVQEELFRPVLAVIRFHDVTEAVKIANHAIWVELSGQARDPSTMG